MYMYITNNVVIANPLAFCFSPYSFLPLCFPSTSFYLLGTLLVVIGSRPPWSQVARKLISPFPSPPHSKIPTPWGFPELNASLLRRHRYTGLQVQNSIFSCVARYIMFNLYTPVYGICIHAVHCVMYILLCMTDVHTLYAEKRALTEMFVSSTFFKI